MKNRHNRERITTGEENLPDPDPQMKSPNQGYIVSQGPSCFACCCCVSLQESVSLQAELHGLTHHVSKDKGVPDRAFAHGVG